MRSCSQGRLGIGTDGSLTLIVSLLLKTLRQGMVIFSNKKKTVQLHHLITVNDGQFEIIAEKTDPNHFA